MADTKDLVDRTVMRRFRVIAWGGMAYLVTQVGTLAYLVWEVYSWDVMEPFTYFLGMAGVWAYFFNFAKNKEVRRGARGEERAGRREGVDCST